MSRTRLLRAALLMAAFAAALVLRCAFNYEAVFRADGVRYQEGDAWFHMRTVRNLMHHFPLRSGFDPYTAFPTGQAMPTAPFFDLAVGTVAFIAGAGSPGGALVDEVGAWFPAVLGALMVVPVYFIGRVLFAPAAGLLAAGMIAILPGYFFRSSLLGFTDHHVAETFLSTLVLLFLLLALTRPRPVPYAVLAGLSLGCYLATRAAGAFLPAVIVLWAVLQCSVNHWSGLGSRLIFRVVCLALAVALAVFLPAGDMVWANYTLLALCGGAATVAVAAILSHILQLRKQPRWVYFALVGGTLAFGLCSFAAFRPDTVRGLIWDIRWRTGGGPAQTVAELRPLLLLNGPFSLKPAWDEFAGSWLLAIPGLLVLALECREKNVPARNLFAVWSAVMLAGALWQYRMSYYLAVSMALLTGYAGWRLLATVRGRLGRLIAVPALAALLVFPAVSKALAVARDDHGPSEAWWSALEWLRTRTPEPMGDAAAFDRYFPRPPGGASFSYPPSAYGVMNWWDYGHLLSAASRRIPVANPTQAGAAEAARFFLSTDPDSAAAILRRNGARYVITDHSLPYYDLDARIPQNGANFRSMTVWAQRPSADYVEVYESTDGAGSINYVIAFYPAYYRSMLVRLQTFAARAAEPALSTWVIRYSGSRRPGTGRRKLVSSALFATYREAAAYLESHRGERLLIAGLDPLKPCVPVERLEGFTASYASPASLVSEEEEGAVRIFEYSARPTAASAPVQLPASRGGSSPRRRSP